MSQVEEAQLVLLISILLRLTICHRIIYREGDPEVPPVIDPGPPQAAGAVVPFTNRKAELHHQGPKA